MYIVYMLHIFPCKTCLYLENTLYFVYLHGEYYYLYLAASSGFRKILCLKILKKSKILNEISLYLKFTIL